MNLSIVKSLFLHMFTTALSNMFIIALERHAKTYSEDTELRKVKVFLSKKTKNDLLQTADIIYQDYPLARRAQVNKNMQDQTKVKTSVKKDLSTIVRT